MMDNYLAELSENIKLEEGIQALLEILIYVYFQKGISTKELARKTLLPVPVVAAIKKEFIKKGLMLQENGVRLTSAGEKLVKETYGYDHLDCVLYQRLYGVQDNWETEFSDELALLEEIFAARPQVDVTIDQSKCTFKTSFRRAILCLKNQSLIGKQILCVGDDDLVSVAISLLLKRLYNGFNQVKTKIHVMDIDRRFLSYISEQAVQRMLPIECHHQDLRMPLPPGLQDRFDCFFTDPPYTLPGLELFISRGITGLKRRPGLPIFLSFAHKSPGFTLDMQKKLAAMGLITYQIMPRFNEYEGAEIIGNTSQMVILKTTGLSAPLIVESFNGPIYTGELKKTYRTYRCKNCGTIIKVGSNETIITIEELKNQGCPKCREKIFELSDKIAMK